MKIQLDADLVQRETEEHYLSQEKERQLWKLPPSPLSRRNKDRLAGQSMAVLTSFAWLLIFALIGALSERALPILREQSLKDLLFSTTWKPLSGLFGFSPFILSSLWVTLVAMAVAVPLSVLVAIYLSEYARPGTRGVALPIIDLLAGIPSVIYGVWGVILVVPLIQTINTPLSRKIPLIQSNNPTGFSILAGGLVLAVMVLPVIISVSEEVIRSVPRGIREASLSLGATRWQTTKHVVLRRARPGILAAIILTWARAIGEFGATVMVAGTAKGQTATLPSSIYLAMSMADLPKAVTLVVILIGISLLVLFAVRKIMEH
jgi:phosphate transport system permease protein